MQERRTLPRKYLMYYSRVYDRRTGELVGNLVDLTPQGAMLLCEKPVPVQVVYRLHMELPDGLADKQHLEFEARSVWCRPDVDPRFFDVGFQLLGVPASDVAIIEHMVEAYELRGR